jgi:hypothetical protein
MMKFQQQPHTLLMIRPKSFGYNSQTESSNAFQNKGELDTRLALKEFDKMVDVLMAHEISIEVFDDTLEPEKPDAIFPNNWLSLHEDGRVVLYPMMAENRRLERRPDIIEKLKNRFMINDVLDLSTEESNARYLEGTGSIIFDHSNRLAYACRSQRTSEILLAELCKKINYKPIMFDALDELGKSIYHTNVMMGIGEKFAIVCLDAIRKDEDQELVLENMANTNHKVISISYDQLKSFAGNILEVKSASGENILLISDTALRSLLPGQVNAITRFAELLPISIPTIEKIGGGGVRCMVAGIHLPVRKLPS